MLDTPDIKIADIEYLVQEDLFSSEFPVRLKACPVFNTVFKLQ